MIVYENFIAIYIQYAKIKYINILQVIQNAYTYANLVNENKYVYIIYIYIYNNNNNNKMKLTVQLIERMNATTKLAMAMG